MLLLQRPCRGAASPATADIPRPESVRPARCRGRGWTLPRCGPCVMAAGTTQTLRGGTRGGWLSGPHAGRSPRSPQATARYGTGGTTWWQSGDTQRHRGDNGRGLAACGETYCEQMLREVTRGSRGRRKLVLPGLGSALAPEPGSGWQESRLPSSASEAGGPGSRHGRGRRLLKPCPCCVEAVPPCVLTRSSLRVSVA